MFWGGGTVSSPPSYHSEVSNSSSSSVTSGYYSPDSTGLHAHPDIQGNISPINGPHLKLTEDAAMQFRFRYMTEMQGTHGAIQGISSSKKKKTFPTVQLCGYEGPAIIRCTLYTSDKKNLHVHRLVGKSSGTEKCDPHDIPVGPNVKNNYTACFQNLVIIHTAKKQFVNEFIEKCNRVQKAKFQSNKELVIDAVLLEKMRKEAEEKRKTMDLNCSRLKFEALIINNGVYHPIPGCEPLFSSIIKNMKNHITGQLKICRVDKVSGSCEGGEEIFLFVEKVGKGNIKVVMTECNEFGEEVWSDECAFSPTDVHHQYGIVCRTPKYRNTDIKEKVSVKLQLERKNDCARSEPIEFIYKPQEVYHVRNNNKRMRVMKDVEKPVRRPNQHLDVTSTTINWEQVNFQVAESHETEPEGESMWVSDIVSIPWGTIDHVDIDRAISVGYNDSNFNAAFDQLPTPDVDKFDVFNSDEIASLVKEDNIRKPPLGAWSRYDNQLEHDGIVDPDTPLSFPYVLLDKTHSKPYVFDDNVKAQGPPMFKAQCEDFSERRMETEKKITDNHLGLIVVREICQYFRYGLQRFDTKSVSHLDNIMQIRSNSGNSVLHTTMKYKQKGYIPLLLKFLIGFQRNNLINCRNCRLQTPLHIGAYSNDKVTIEIMHKFLDAGADPNLLDCDGRSPLHIAIRSKCPDTVACLLGSPQIDVDCISECDGTALHISAENNDVEMTRLLIEHGADINAINRKTGRTPLHAAVSLKNDDIVTLLLQQKNIEVNKKDFNGYNTLKLAFTDENIPWRRICQQLIKHGATFTDSEKKPLKSKTLDDGTDELFEKFVELWIQEPQKKK